MGDASRLLLAEQMAAAAIYARDMVRNILSEDPQLSGQEVLSRLERSAQEHQQKARRTAQELTEEAECRHCGYLIVRIGDSGWRHTSGSVGCRAASFDRDGDWDDKLDRRWKAAP